MMYEIDSQKVQTESVYDKKECSETHVIGAFA